jgi:hypothetical protein
MALSYCCHDHIVFLLDKADFENAPSWLGDNFTIIEGGTHRGGSSKNKLIVFSDGTYLELFTWISKPTEFTSWADKPPGLIDFALTTLRPFNAEKNHTTVQRNLKNAEGDGELGVRYKDPLAGGRKRQDGEEVRWEVTRPEYSSAANTPAGEYFPTGRIDTPFFCHDLTPRVVRVPFDDDALTKHKCKALGIAGVDVIVPADKLSAYSTLYASITGDAPHQIDDKEKKGVYFKLTTPTSQGSGPVIRVRIPTSAEDEKWLVERGAGIREIQLSIGGRKDHGEERLRTDGLGSTVSLSW